MPRRLPAAVADFTGRAAELAALTSMMDKARASVPGTVVITAIGGTAGVGKTALALHWAHQVADRFPDGQLYVNLRGFDPSGTPVHARRGDPRVPGRTGRAAGADPAGPGGAGGRCTAACWRTGGC